MFWIYFYRCLTLFHYTKMCDTDKCLHQLNVFSFATVVVNKKLKTVKKLNINYVLEIVELDSLNFFPNPCYVIHD